MNETDSLSQQADRALDNSKAKYAKNLLDKEKQKELYSKPAIVTGYGANGVYVKELGQNPTLRTLGTNGGLGIGSPAIVRDEVVYAMPRVKRDEPVEKPNVETALIKHVELVKNGDLLEFWLCGHLKKPEKIYTLDFLNATPRYGNIANADGDYIFDLRIDATGKRSEDWLLSFGVSEILSFNPGVSTTRRNTIYNLKKSGITTVLTEEITNVFFSGGQSGQSVSYVNLANGYWGRIDTITTGDGSQIVNSNTEITYYWKSETYTGSSNQDFVSGGINNTDGIYYPYPGQAFEFSSTATTGDRYNPFSLTNKDGTGAILGGFRNSVYTDFAFYNGSVAVTPSGGTFIYLLFPFRMSVLATKIAVIKSIALFGTNQKLKAEVDFYDLANLEFIQTKQIAYFQVDITSIASSFDDLTYTSNFSCWS